MLLAASALAVALSVPAAAGAAGAGRIAFVSFESTDGAARATHNVYTATPQGTETRLVARDANDPVWSPDGRWIAYVSVAGAGSPSVWRVRADGTDHRRVSPPGSAVDPAWSPDGRWLTYTRLWDVMEDGFLQPRSAVHVVRRHGRGARKLHRGGQGRGAVWAPGGRRIAFVSRDRIATIRRDGTALRILRRDAAPAYLQFSPTGPRLAFTDSRGVRNVRAAVRVLDLATGSLRTIARADAPGRFASVTWTPDGERLALLRDRWVRVDAGFALEAVELCTADPDAPVFECPDTLPPGGVSDSLSWTG